MKTISCTSIRNHKPTIAIFVTCLLFIPILLSAPLLILALVAATLGTILLVKPVGRLAIFTLGGLFALGGTSGAGLLKLLYLLAICSCFILAAHNLSRPGVAVMPAQIRLAWQATFTMFALIGMACTVGALNSNNISDIGQDTFTYLMLAVAPIIGLDASSSKNPKAVKYLVLILGLISATAWAVWWLSLRGNQLGSITHIALPTSFLGFATFSIGLALAIKSTNRLSQVLWGTFSVVIPALYIASGSRSMVVFALGLLAFLGSRKHGRVSAIKWASAIAIVGTVTWSLVPYLISLLPNGAKIADRFTRTFSMVENGSITADGSLSDRTLAYQITFELFVSHPAVGLGFGYIYPSTRGLGIGDLKLDSPFLILSKFGIAGFALLVVYVFKIWQIVRANRTYKRHRIGETILLSYLFITLGRMIFVAPTEDKGTALALAILICAATSLFPSTLNTSSSRRYALPSTAEPRS